MENERIEVVKNWSKPKSIRDIQVFLDFANFYQCFIQGLSKIAGLLTLMLKTIRLTNLSTILQLLIDMADKNEVGRGKSDGNETNLSNLSVSKRFTGASYLTSGGTKKGGGNTKKGVKATKSSNYLILDANKAYNHLQHAFIQVPIFKHFDPKRHIQIEINTSRYAINRVLNELTLDNLG